MDLEAKVRDTIRKYEMLSFGDGVLLGVSGGPDSVALLRLMTSLGKECGWRLAVAHLLHGIRGEEARKDALFVAELAEKSSIPFYLKEVDLPRMRSERGKGNLEELGRKERYGFFAAVSAQCGLNKVATAHTRDDQVETLLMWLLRGSGRKGLSGIYVVRKLTSKGRSSAKPLLVRPLIDASRQEILAYLAEQGLDYRTDDTNLDRCHLRNWIRHRLLPQLRKRIDRRLDHRLAHLAEILRDEEGVLDRITQRRLDRLGRSRCFTRESLLQEDKAMQRRLVRAWLESNSGSLRGIAFDHVEAILRFIAQGPPHGRLSLPGGWDLLRQYEAIRLERGGRKELPEVSYSYFLPHGGEVVIPEAGVKLQSSRCSSSFVTRPQDDLEALFDSALLPDTLTVRSFRAGDCFQPLGMCGHKKKVKDLLIEKKVPLPIRRILPLVLAGGEILWIPQYGRSEIAKVGPQTGEILKVKLTFLNL
ncbi:MAG: tRNA lysidine(34) synthetase TilS [Candidatus Binatia bacterium]